MKPLLAIGAALLMIFSCTVIETDRTLNDVESFIMDHPDSALLILESMNRKDLKTARTKAHHALLHAMALDKNYIDVKDDSIASVAVEYYLKHGPDRNRARTLYYLGVSYYNNEEYDKAILAYSRAESFAADCDSLYLGMIYSAKSYTYNCNYNSSQELYYAKRAFETFSSIKADKYKRISSYRLAVSYHNNDNYEKAIKQYDYLIDSTSFIDFIFIQSILGKAHSMIEIDGDDYRVVESLFRKAKYEYDADFEEKDYWAWAYSLYRTGRNKEADEIISKLEISDEFIADFWRARIAAYFKDYEAVYKYDNITLKRQNDIVEELLEESLAIYQSDYYQTQLELSEYKVRTRTIGLLGFIVLIILVSVILLLAINRYIRKQKAEKNKLFEYAEEIKRQLEEAEGKDYSELKRKFISLYRTRFETIGTLCDHYIQSAGRIDIESLMFKKVETLISEVKNDSVNRMAFESMLDNDLDMIMTHLRTEMPKMKELDYAIFSYIIVGFDATTISRLLDMTVNNVYAHKRRIRVKIEEKHPEHAEQFLEMLV